MKLRLYNSGIVEVQSGWFAVSWACEAGKERSQIGKGKMVKGGHSSSDDHGGVQQENEVGKPRCLKPHPFR